METNRSNKIIIESVLEFALSHFRLVENQVHFTLVDQSLTEFAERSANLPWNPGSELYTKVSALHPGEHFKTELCGDMASYLGSILTDLTLDRSGGAAINEKFFSSETGSHKYLVTWMKKYMKLPEELTGMNFDPVKALGLFFTQMKTILNIARLKYDLMVTAHESLVKLRELDDNLDNMVTGWRLGDESGESLRIYLAEMRRTLMGLDDSLDKGLRLTITDNPFKIPRIHPFIGSEVINLTSDTDLVTFISQNINKVSKVTGVVSLNMEGERKLARTFFNYLRNTNMRMNTYSEEIISFRHQESGRRGAGDEYPRADRGGGGGQDRDDIDRRERERDQRRREDEIQKVQNEKYALEASLQGTYDLLQDEKTNQDASQLKNFLINISGVIKRIDDFAQKTQMIAEIRDENQELSSAKILFWNLQKEFGRIQQGVADKKSTHEKAMRGWTESLKSENLPKLDSPEDYTLWIITVRDWYERVSQDETQVGMNLLKRKLFESLDIAKEHQDAYKDVNTLLQFAHNKFAGSDDLGRVEINRVLQLREPRTRVECRENIEVSIPAFKRMIRLEITHNISSEDLANFPTKTFLRHQRFEYEKLLAAFVKLSETRQREVITTGDLSAVSTKIDVDSFNQEFGLSGAGVAEEASIFTPGEAIRKMERNTSQASLQNQFQFYLRFLYRVKNELNSSLAQEQIKNNSQASTSHSSTERKKGWRQEDINRMTLDEEADTESDDDEIAVNVLHQRKDKEKKFEKNKKGQKKDVKKFQEKRKDAKLEKRSPQQGKTQKHVRPAEFKAGRRMKPKNQPCPFNCDAESGHYWGSGALCRYFQKLPRPKRITLAKSIKTLLLCCLKINAHSREQQCFSGPCKHCNSTGHHHLICSSPAAFAADEDFKRSKDDDKKMLIRRLIEEENLSEDEASAMADEFSNDLTSDSDEAEGEDQSDSDTDTNIATLSIRMIRVESEDEEADDVVTTPALEETTPALEEDVDMNSDDQVRQRPRLPPLSVPGREISRSQTPEPASSATFRSRDLSPTNSEPDCSQHITSELRTLILEKTGFKINNSKQLATLPVETRKHFMDQLDEYIEEVQKKNGFIKSEFEKKMKRYWARNTCYETTHKINSPEHAWRRCCTGCVSYLLVNIFDTPEQYQHVTEGLDTSCHGNCPGITRYDPDNPFNIQQNMDDDDEDDGDLGSWSPETCSTYQHEEDDISMDGLDLDLDALAANHGLMTGTGGPGHQRLTSTGVPRDHDLTPGAGGSGSSGMMNDAGGGECDHGLMTTTGATSDIAVLTDAGGPGLSCCPPTRGTGPPRHFQCQQFTQLSHERKLQLLQRPTVLTGSAAPGDQCLTVAGGPASHGLTPAPGHTDDHDLTPDTGGSDEADATSSHSSMGTSNTPPPLNTVLLCSDLSQTELIEEIGAAIPGNILIEEIGDAIPGNILIEEIGAVGELHTGPTSAPLTDGRDGGRSGELHSGPDQTPLGEIGELRMGPIISNPSSSDSGGTAVDSSRMIDEIIVNAIRRFHQTSGETAINLDSQGEEMTDDDSDRDHNISINVVTLDDAADVDLEDALREEMEIELQEEVEWGVDTPFNDLTMSDLGEVYEIMFDNLDDFITLNRTNMDSEVDQAEALESLRQYMSRYAEDIQSGVARNMAEEVKQGELLLKEETIKKKMEATLRDQEIKGDHPPERYCGLRRIGVRTDSSTGSVMSESSIAVRTAETESILSRNTLTLTPSRSNPNFTELGPQDGCTKLYQRLLSEANFIHSACESVCQPVIHVRVVIHNANRNKMNRLASIGIVVEKHLGYHVAILVFLLDTGADGNVIIREVDDLGVMLPLHDKQKTLSGINSLPQTVPRRMITFIDKEGELINAAINTVDHLSPPKALRSIHVNIIRKSFNITDEMVSQVSWVEGSQKLHGILGQSDCKFLGETLSNHDVIMAGFEVPTSNPNLKLISTPLGIKSYAVVGSFGVHYSVATLNNPKFTLPFFSSIKLLNINPENLQSWRRPGSRVKQIMISWKDVAMGERMVLDGDNYSGGAGPSDLGDLEISAKRRKVLQENNITINRVKLWRPYKGETDVKLFDDEDETGMEEAKLQEMLKQDKIMPQTKPLCTVHSKLVSRCELCRKKVNMMSDQEQKLYQDIMNSATRVYDDGGGFQVMFKLISEENVENVFWNSNKAEVEADTIRLVKRLKKAGRNICQGFHQNILEQHQKDNFIEELTKQEVEDLQNRPHYFLSINFVLNSASASTPFRIIVDTSRVIKNRFTTHSQVFRSPAGCLNNSLEIILAKTLYEMSWSADGSKAYKRLLLDEESTNYVLMCWVKDPEAEELEFVYYRCKTFLFGVSQSAVALEIYQEHHAAPMCSMEESARVIKDQSYADDTGDSHVSRYWALKIVDDVKRAFEISGMPIKKVVGNRSLFPDHCNKPELLLDNSFGLLFDYLHQNMMVSCSLNLFPKKRGRETGESLNKTNIFDERIILTKRDLLRIGAQLYQLTGTIVGPLSFMIKLLLAQLQKILPHGVKGYDLAIRDLSPEFEQECKRSLESIKDYQQQVRPFLNFSVPHQYEVESIHVHHDGSSQGYAATCYIVSKRFRTENGPPYFSYIFLAKNHISQLSVPICEAKSMGLAMECLLTVIKAIGHKLQDGVKMYICGDSKAMAFSMSNKVVVKNITIKNVVSYVKGKAYEAVSMLPTSTLTFCHIPGKLNAADKNSKLQENPIETLNSVEWRHGSLVMFDTQLLEKVAYFTVSLKDETYKQPTGADIDPATMNLLQKPTTSKMTPPAPPTPPDRGSGGSGGQMDQDLGQHEEEDLEEGEIPDSEDEHDDNGDQSGHGSLEINTSNSGQSHRDLRDILDSDDEERDIRNLAINIVTESNQEDQDDGGTDATPAYPNDYERRRAITKVRQWIVSAQNTGEDAQNTGEDAEVDDDDDQEEASKRTGDFTEVNDYIEQEEIVKKTEDLNLDDHESEKSLESSHGSEESHDSDTSDDDGRDQISSDILSSYYGATQENTKFDFIADSVSVDDVHRALSFNHLHCDHLSPEEVSHACDEERKVGLLLNKMSVGADVDDEDADDVHYKLTGDYNNIYAVCEGNAVSKYKTALSVKERKRTWDALRSVKTQSKMIGRHVKDFASKRRGLKDRSRFNLIQPNSVSLFTGTLDADEYDAIVKRTKSFSKRLGITMRIVKYVVMMKKVLNRKRKREEDDALSGSCELEQGYMLMLRTDQARYPAKRRRKDGLVTLGCGVLGRMLRIGETSALKLFGARTLPHLSTNSPLLESLFYFKHVCEIEGLNDAHLGTVSTVAAMTTGQVGVTSHSLMRFVANKRLECPPCLRMECKQYCFSVGVMIKSGAAMERGSIPWEHLSIDQLPSFKVKLDGSRHYALYPLLAIIDLYSSAVCLLPMKDMSRPTLVQTLKWFQLRTGVPISTVHADFHKVFQNINELWPGVELSTSLRRGQNSNKIESRVKFIKTIIQGSLGKNRNESFGGVINILELLRLLDMTATIINEVPLMMFEGASMIAPDHYVRPLRYLMTNDRCLEAGGELQPGEDFSKRLEEYFDEIRRVRDDEFRAQEKKYRQIYRGSLDFKPSVGDIVFIQESNIKEKPQLGRVVKVYGTSAELMMARTRAVKRYPVHKLFVLLHLRPSDLEKNLEKENMEEEMDLDMREGHSRLNDQGEDRDQGLDTTRITSSGVQLRSGKKLRK